MTRYILAHQTARDRAKAAIDDAEDGYVVEIKEPTRNLAMNAKLWAMLAEIATQTDWHGIKLSSEEWKDLLSAGLVKSKVVPNMDGSGFVILGQRTSKMTKRQFAELIDLVECFGTERGVKFADDPIEPPEGYR